MADFGELSEIADSLAAAAIDPSRWDAAMDAAAKATGSVGALLFPARGRLPQVPMSEGMRRSTEAYIGEGWVNRDERYRVLHKILREGVATEFDFITADQMDRQPYYQEFLRPHGLRWFAGVKLGEREDVWLLSLQRSIAQGPFSPAEIKRLAALSRRLAGAAELARAFGFARVEGALQAFEASGSAVAMIDCFGEVLRLNRSAERLLGPDLQIIRHRIVSADRDATAALDRALHGLIWTREDEVFHPRVVLPRRLGRPMIAYPSRLASAAREGFALCVGFVVFVDLQARLTPAPDILTRTFGLTQAEARLAAAFADGRSLEDIAEQRGISLTTARNQLKAVFTKTDTHRQSELVALLAKL